MFDHIKKHLSEYENHDKDQSSQQNATKHLRKLGLGDFVGVMSHLPLKDYPVFSSCLPNMTEDDICKTWTGNIGSVVMEQALDFVRSCADRYVAITGQNLAGGRILDFGCGYGRFLRCFSFFSDEVYGVDAWDSSLDHCRKAGFANFVSKSEVVPTNLPVPGQFNLTTAFSVFTHLSEESTVASLAALRKSAITGGVLAITIRPIEYWNFASVNGMLNSDFKVEELTHNHDNLGFAFMPHGGSNHYGDTSMTIDWLRRSALGWEVVAIDRSPKDQLQRYVFLRAI